MSYNEIRNNTKDYRADRITSYLNMVNKLVTRKFESFTSATHDKFDEIQKYFKDDGEKVQELCNYILNSRNVKIKENIRRKMPKL